MLEPGLTQAGGLRQPKKRVELLFLSAWCGLAAGLLELGTRVVCRAIDPSQRLYLMSRHFVWLGPFSNLIFFFSLGLLLATATKLVPRAAAWFGSRLICAAPYCQFSWRYGLKYTRQHGYSFQSGLR